MGFYENIPLFCRMQRLLTLPEMNGRRFSVTFFRQKSPEILTAVFGNIAGRDIILS
jgi:hypothetical protein